MPAGSDQVNRVSGGGRRCCRRLRTTPPAPSCASPRTPATVATAAPTHHPDHGRGRCAGCRSAGRDTGATVGSTGTPDACSSAQTRSDADWNRSAGVFSSSRRRIAASARRDVSCDRRARSGGGSCRIACSVSIVCSRANARAPGQHLEEHRSEREQVGTGVDGFAANLLGREIARRSRAARRSVVRESPIRARPRPAPAWRCRSRESWSTAERVRKMFSGFKSRCTRPAACAATSPRAISRRNPSGSAGAIGAAGDPRRAASRPRAVPRRGTARSSKTTDVVDLDDVGMVERRRDPRFLQEPLDAMAIGRRPCRASTFSATSRRSRTSVAR